MDRLAQFKRYIILLSILWTVFVVVGVALDLANVQQEIFDIAYYTAEVTFQKDLAFRRWASGHGGVYVPTTEATKPSIYLKDVKERDIKSPSGKQFTLINPARMIKQVHVLDSGVLAGVRGHITSLQPIAPENGADAWEAKALALFEKGDKEVTELSKIDNAEYLRLMRPIFIEESCLKCHRQGYKVGDVRGGISVAVPIEPIWHTVGEREFYQIFIFVLLWAGGMFGIFWGGRKLKKRMVQRDEAEAFARRIAQKYHHIFETAPAATLELDFTGIKPLLDQLKQKMATPAADKSVASIAYSIKYTLHMIKIVDVNSAALELFEVEDKQQLISCFRDAFTVDGLEKLTALIEALAQGKSSFQAETTALSVKGKLLHLFVSTTMPVETSEYGHVLFSLIDITDRKIAEEESKKQLYFIESLIESIPNPLFYRTCDGVYVGCNIAFAELAGLTKDKILGRSVNDIIPAEIAEENRKSDEQLLTKPGLHVSEIKFPNRDGCWRRMIVTKKTYFDSTGRVAGIIGVITDITVQTEREQDLLKTKQEPNLELN